MMALKTAAMLALVATLALAPLAATAAEVSAADRTAIQTTIESQLSAFQRDDGPAAFAYAAPTIRQKFGSATNFMDMVRTGYAPVYRPSEVEFRDVTEIAGAPTQTVVVVGPDGFAYLALYVMGQQPDGRWLIEGCILRKLTDVSA